MPNKFEDIIFLFLNNESKIEKLYKMFMIKFPSHQKLWGKLAAKKRYQVEALKDLSLRFDRYNFFKMNGHAIGILNYVNNFIDDQIRKIKEEKIYLPEALMVASRLERSLKEKDSVKLLEPKHNDVFKIFKMFNHQSEQHVSLLFDAYSKLA